MTNRSFSLVLASADQTADFAHQLARVLTVGDVVALTGDIGAGKTHFARSLIQSLQDMPEDVPSPTFTLVQVYETRAGDVWHADLYRLSSVDESIELGLTEAFETAICLIEWPDRLGDLLPPEALNLTFSQGTEDDSRNLRIDWSADKWGSLIPGLAA